MCRRAWMVCLGVSVSLVGLRGQIRETPAPAPASSDGPTFKTATRLATIDAVVVDRDGRHVTDLTPADFEVLERGKPQRIRQAVYVRVDRPAPARAGAVPAGGTAGSAAPRPTRTLGSGLPAADRTGRILALVVDDLGLSLESIASVRQMLATYIDTHIEPGDLVAIIRTSGGTGALQQFTTDRRLLRAAAERVRWTSQGRQGSGTFTPLLPTVVGSRTGPPGSIGDADGPVLVPDRDGSAEETVDDLRHDAASSGSLGALLYVLRGIETLPGRKSVVFVSEGFDFGLDDSAGRDRTSRDRRGRTWDGFTRVIDRANRSGVVLYAIDPRGLQYTGLTAQDTLHLPGGLNGPDGATAYTQALDDRTRTRRRELENSQQSLVHLADQTGGFAIVSNNGLAQGLSRITDDMRGYYLIGFDTALDADVPWNPDDVRIRVTRKDLVVRARRGLFGPAAPPMKPLASADPLVAAVLSPFDAGTIDVRLTGLFSYDAKTGGYVHAAFFVDPATLTFVDADQGRRRASLSVLLVAIGDDGVPVARVRRQVEMTLEPETYRLARQQGLLYTERLPLKTPGGYQLRAAIRDDRAGTIGTSAQFVDVPRVGKGRLALSGIAIMDATNAKRAVGLDAVSAVPAAEGASDALADGALAGPATKVFRPGSEVVYACEIYDGRGKRTVPLSMQTTLLRDGQAIFRGPASRVAGADGAEKPVGIVHASGSVTLGRDLPHGRYSLQVRVAPATTRRPQATQWIEFDVR